MAEIVQLLYTSPLLSGLDTPLFTVGAVARQTGIPAVTLRAWERRYGFPRPTRAGRGRRLYTQRDVDTLRELRLQTARGVPISRAIALLPPADQEPAALSLHNASISPTIEGDTPRELLERRLVEAFVAMNPSLAETVLSEALGQLTVEEVCLGVMQPALNEIGRRWHEGEAWVAQEHFATALLRARLGSMLHLARTSAELPAMLAACAPGESHELGLLMVCLFLARRGYAVRYLGANLPAEELGRVVREGPPRLVLLSAQTDDTAERLIDVLRSVRRLPPPRPELAYGGWIFNFRPELRARTPGIFVGADARAAVDTIARLLTHAPALQATIVGPLGVPPD